ncbi:sac3 ganp domain [Pyrenophora seminiperda CCB06]|uniref:Sac3 ganp domain n=1 Tax=Pyrenophora seminiperda CCB06 TaxID=1302712 RepID=A0A3M7MGJ6_9PLEO|nr:sac3 ganp domain [Pyrenophora seminiperda CCB06]
MQQPAYNAVTPRTTLQPASAHVSFYQPRLDAADAHPRTQATMAPEAPKKKVEWPLPVREYVRRAFEPANAIPGISMEDMQERLKTTIAFFAERNSTDTVDWPAFPLPQKLLLEERRAAAARGTPAHGITDSVHPAHMNGSAQQTNQISPTSRKRNAHDAQELQAEEQMQANLPPWRKTNLVSRMTYPDDHNSKRQKKNALADAPSKFDQAELDKRRQRFQLDSSSSKTTPLWGSSRKDEDEMPTGPVVGTNECLEKSYFRLTAPPKAETVRPLHVLKKTLTMLVAKWKADKNYNYICNQFKSLRQDLTVQHIKDDFTVKVYEIHARISLEKGDLGEYNQCQTQLKALYAQNLGGNPAEFKAYRILYFVYTCNKTDMNDMLAELTLADKQHKWIKHALDVRSSLALGNYHKFFRLYLEAENMGAYLMDMFVERERLNAMANISRGYVTVSLRFLTDELGFDNDATCREFLESHGAQGAIEYKDKQLHVKLRDVVQLFEKRRAAAFSKVDIKGQI